jgi:hypothetical protein
MVMLILLMLTFKVLKLLPSISLLMTFLVFGGISVSKLTILILMLHKQRHPLILTPMVMAYQTSKHCALV